MLKLSIAVHKRHVVVMHLKLHYLLQGSLQLLGRAVVDRLYVNWRRFSFNDFGAFAVI